VFAFLRGIRVVQKDPVCLGLRGKLFDMEKLLQSRAVVPGSRRRSPQQEVRHEE
jgi:hypothetical protein